MKTSTIRLSIFAMLLVSAGIGWAGDEMEKLPAGPIRERGKLMEDLGAKAKTIGKTLRDGKSEGIAEAAEAIRDESKRIPGLFPQGSIDPSSRASEMIWKDWDRFEREAQTLTDAAAALAAAARSSKDLEQTSRQLFQTCKGCHEAFRLPEK
jgi:cytochrome c556